MLVKRLRYEEKLMCPNVLTLPTHPAHMLQVSILNAFHDAAEKDEDGEMLPPVGKAYYAASEGEVNDRMDLYHHEVLADHITWVQTWYWRCHVCGDRKSVV